MATRGKMRNASTLAGRMAFSRAGLGLNHAIAHQLGGQFRLPHGLVMPLLLTTVIRFNAGDPRAAKRYARIVKPAAFARQRSRNVAAINALIQQIELLKATLCPFPHWPLRLRRSDFSHAFRRWCELRWLTLRCALTRAGQCKPFGNCWRNCYGVPPSTSLKCLT